MKRLFLILILAVLCIIGYSQSDEKGLSNLNIYHQKGDDHFERYEFRKAIIFYSRALKKDTSDYMALLKMADAYSKINLPLQAEECYKLAIESKREIEKEYLLKYALALLVNKKYDESRHWLKLSNESVENDIRAENYLESIENRDQLYRDSTIRIVENVDELNSIESEINPVLYQDQMIFASSRTNSIDVISKSNYDIFCAEHSPIGEFINVSSFNNYLNSSFHEGPIAISGDGSVLFCTRNIDQKDSRNKVKLGIIKTVLPNHINQRLDLTNVFIGNFDYSIGHPTVNHDGTVLYFISNALESTNGLDIYRSSYMDGKWAEPENLGEIINTKGDEMFPYLYNDTLLYFASNGHGGLGGLDIFKVNLTTEPMELINLGYPINSRFDDFSLFPMLGGQSGYFCSNRPGGVGSDDIYKFDILNFKIKGSLLDAKDKTIIEDAKISVLTDDGEEYLISETQGGKFEFSIIPGENYTLIIENDDYETEEIFFSKDMTSEMKKQMLIELEPIQKTEIKLEAGQKYNFISGNDSLNIHFRNEFDQMFEKYNYTDSDTADITILEKQLKFSEGSIYSMQLIKDVDIDSAMISAPTTLLLFHNDTVSLTNDSLLFTVPANEESYFRLESDLDYISQNYPLGNLALNIDRNPVFDEEVTEITADEKEAIKELEWLMSISINTTTTEEKDTAVQSVSSGGFSFIPRSGYTLKVGKKEASGGAGKELNLPLTEGVKYNFSSDPDILYSERLKLDSLLKDREGIDIKEDKALNIHYFSKELEIKEGEEFAFSLMPDSLNKALDIPEGDQGSTVFLDDRIFEIKTDEKFQINIPYTPDRKININTDIQYLKENFQPEEYYLELDTIPFFSEMLVDTTGLFARYLDSTLKRSGDQTHIPIITSENTILKSDIRYRVLILATREPVTEKYLINKYAGKLEVMRFKEDNWYKYYIAEVPTYFEARLILNDCGVKDASIVAYQEGTLVSLQDAMALQYRNRMWKSGQEITDSIVNIVTVNFEFDKFSLRTNEENYLRELEINKLLEKDNTYVTINGHTDIRGSDVYNYRLSEKRAKYVKSLLLKEGIDESRIRTYSYGESQLLKICEIPDECDESVHRINRRVEIVLFQPCE